MSAQRLSQLQAEYAALKRENAALAERLRQAEAAKGSSSSSRPVSDAVVASLQEDLRKCRAENKDLTSGLNELERTSVQQAAELTQLREVAGALAAAQERLAELEALHEEQRGRAARRESDDALNDLLSRVAEMTERLDAAEAENKRLAEENRRLTKVGVQLF